MNDDGTDVQQVNPSLVSTNGIDGTLYCAFLFVPAIGTISLEGHKRTPDNGQYSKKIKLYETRKNNFFISEYFFTIFKYRDSKSRLDRRCRQLK